MNAALFIADQGYEYEIIGAALHGRDGGVNRRIAGDDDG